MLMHLVNGAQFLNNTCILEIYLCAANTKAVMVSLRSTYASL